MNHRTYKQPGGFKLRLEFTLFSVRSGSDSYMVGAIPKYKLSSISTINKLSDVLQKDYPTLTTDCIYLHTDKHRCTTSLFAFVDKPKPTYKLRDVDPRGE